MGELMYTNLLDWKREVHLGRPDNFMGFSDVKLEARRHPGRWDEKDMCAGGRILVLRSSQEGVSFIQKREKDERRKPTAEFSFGKKITTPRGEGKVMFWRSMDDLVYSNWVTGRCELSTEAVLPQTIHPA